MFLFYGWNNISYTSNTKSLQTAGSTICKYTAFYSSLFTPSSQSVCWVQGTHWTKHRPLPLQSLHLDKVGCRRATGKEDNKEQSGYTQTLPHTFMIFNRNPIFISLNFTGQMVYLLNDLCTSLFLVDICRYPEGVERVTFKEYVVKNKLYTCRPIFRIQK